MHASRDKLPVEILGDRYETRLADWGEYTAYFERIPGGTDFGAYYHLRVPALGIRLQGEGALRSRRRPQGGDLGG